jgi:predicted enzyme related to lactoylglutathione lyase
MENTVRLFEIPVRDFKRGVQFYSAVFGLKLQVMNLEGRKMAFFPTKHGGVGGAIVSGKGYTPTEKGSIPYISFTEDINNILSKVTLEGGEVIVPPKTAIYGAEGKFAMFIDVDGNRIGILRSDLK